MGILVIAAVGVLALAGVVALINLIGKSSVRGRARTTWLSVALALATVVGAGMLSYASGYYVMPSSWIAALAAAGIVIAALFVLIGIDVRWRSSRLLALVGLVLATGIAFGALAMTGIGGEGVHPYKARARQIAEANGFTALIPAGRKLPTDFLPIEALPAPDAGVSFSYDEFTLQERRAARPMALADLERLVAPGTMPAGEATVPEGAKVTTLTVAGRPAVASCQEVVFAQGWAIVIPVGRIPVIGKDDHTLRGHLQLHGQPGMGMAFAPLYRQDGVAFPGPRKIASLPYLSIRKAKATPQSW